MRKQGFKYLMVICLLVVYVNRGFFVSAPEAEPFTNPALERGEINSMIELLQWVICGHENGIDEDGDSPESYNVAHHHFLIIDPNLFFTFELKQPLVLVSKTRLPFDERILVLPVYGTIDHPPEEA